MSSKYCSVRFCWDCKCNFKYVLVEYRDMCVYTYRNPLQIQECTGVTYEHAKVFRVPL